MTAFFSTLSGAAALLAALLCGPPLRPAAAAPGSPAALVLAQSGYWYLPDRPECAAAAAATAEALGRAGFEVELLQDSTHGEVSAALMRFRTARAEGNRPGMVYFCGYGTVFDGRSFLLPVSARMNRMTDAVSEGIPAPALRELPGSGLVLLDLAPLRDGDAESLLGLAQGTPLPRTGSIAAHGADPAPLAAALPATLAAAAPEMAVATMIARLSLEIPPGPKAQAASLPQERETQLAPPPQPGPAAPPAAEAAAPVPPQAAAALTRADRRMIQLSLQRLGYYSGPIDGLFGPASISAIRMYQGESGSRRSGDLGPDDIAALMSVME
ncbi:peptidoglycan-binding domain-containing protein [Poseidonocella sp. HB161398]|uniref:peptidoglycan-binding domain-containing protein n=1 Tax=Poseidonocella sp. HB161398 TaxID=2320855 RepID=UPI001109E0D5|nr:peptidoglycan-binding domain-containing protein [Poseidonocella sp. HB161398]